MLTKFYLHYDNTQYELKDDDLYNWDQIKCSYKRDNYDGVVRSFTSQFVFINLAREILLALYLRHRFNTQALISVHTVNDRWEWKEIFTCPLDFSTITWDKYTLKINAVDNSVASLIKANKSTKYEFKVDEDVKSDAVFLFNRLPIKEGLTYEITDGTSDTEDGSLYLEAAENDRIYCGVVNSEEIYIGGAVFWEDDQNKDPGSYMIIARTDVKVTLDVKFESDRCYSTGNGMYVSFQIIRSNGQTETIVTGTSSEYNIGALGKVYCGTYRSEGRLKADYPLSRIVVDGIPKTNYWAIVNGCVWEVVHKGSSDMTFWENQNVSADTYRRLIQGGRAVVSLGKGDKIAMAALGTAAHVYSSSINFSWIVKGTPCHIQAFSPETLAEALISRMTENTVLPLVNISGYDGRIAKTMIMAAESIRGLTGSKLYSSFSDFTDWMSTVFGYVYYLEELRDSSFRLHNVATGGCTSMEYPVNDEPWSDHNDSIPGPEDILYFEHYGKFVASNGTQWFGNFPGDTAYNDSATGLARTDVVFTLERYRNGVRTTGLYYFVIGPDGMLDFEPVEFKGTVDDIYKPVQTVNFVHRSELFDKDKAIRRINSIKDVSYNVDNSVIYSTVIAGYEKKEYDNINGRDEFNFGNTYTTGCSVNDKTLSLISKYRADCYGMEFAAQKRGASSTDTTSDQDVFFVLCRCNDEGLMMPDTSCKIENAMSDELFNGYFSPMECIRANAGLICRQADEMTLQFASSTGNSDVILNGTSMTSDIELDTPFATAGWIEFATDKADNIADINEMIEIMDDSVVYRGFLKEVDIQFARNETVRYKLIIKDIIS